MVMAAKGPVRKIEHHWVYFRGNVLAILIFRAVFLSSIKSTSTDKTSKHRQTDRGWSYLCHCLPFRDLKAQIMENGVF